MYIYYIVQEHLQNDLRRSFAKIKIKKNSIFSHSIRFYLYQYFLGTPNSPGRDGLRSCRLREDKSKQKQPALIYSYAVYILSCILYI
jgi:hypothetical protein